MSFWLIVTKNHNCFVVENVPEPDANYETVIPFGTWNDAQVAKDLFYAYNGAENAKLRDTINTQAEIIRKQNAEIENQRFRIEEWNITATNLSIAIDGLRRVMRRVMSQLALQNILPNTHAERNSENREIVGDMKYWHDKPIDSYSHPTLQDMDDIPF